MSSILSDAEANSADIPEHTTVYVVDDDSDSRNSVAALAKSLGLDCLTFSSAEEYLRSNPSARPACMVLDLVLDGIGGVELLQHLEDAPQPVPVIMITAYAEVSSVISCMEAGAMTLLEKPILTGKLSQAITQAIDFDREQLTLSDRLQKLQVVENILVDRERFVLRRIVAGRLNKKDR